MDAHRTDTTPLDPGSPQGRGVAPRPDPATERKLWFSILGPAAAWTVAEVVGAGLAGRVCSPVGLAPEQGLTATLGTWQWIAAFAIPLAAGIIATSGLLLAIGVFRRWRTSADRITRAEGWNRVEFMAMAGAIISFSLLLNIVYFALLPAIVDPCLRTT
jgi:MFS family permease